MVFIFVGGYLAYFLYLMLWANKPWKLRIDKNFAPSITILVPVHNEEKTIEAKLENIYKAAYPKQKIEVVLADDASTDSTLEKLNNLPKKYPELRIKVLNQKPRVGKAKVLNLALSVSTHDIVIVSDADCCWPSDILARALPYLSDPTIGAITGMGTVENSELSWIIKGESNYLKATSFLRLGESKIYSTLRFEGGFCAFKRAAFKKFDCESGSDDSGTALRVVQNGFRAIFVPEAKFQTKFPTKLTGKIRVKIRRANHLMWLWIECLLLMVKGILLLPKRIALCEIFLFVLCPLIFATLLVLTLVISIVWPTFFAVLAIVLLALSLVPQLRTYLVEVAIDNAILFYSLISCVRRKRIVAWEKTR